MSATSLPLLDLFNRLREDELPLGTGEYLLLLRALRLGFGQDPASLYRLCARLWAKSKAQERILSEYWEDYFGAAAPESTQVAAPAGEADTTRRGRTGPRQETQQPGQTTSAAPHAGEAAANEPVSSEAGQETGWLQGESQAAVDERPIERIEVRFRRPLDAAARTRFILTGDYSPVTQRQMKQAVRYLRRLQRAGPRKVLDVPATVDRIGREGLLIEPVLVPLRTNQAQLILLVDRDGSMVPFHALADQLVDTCQRAGRLGRFAAFYFHNTPTAAPGPSGQEFFLYRHKAVVSEVPLPDVFEKFDPEQVSLLVFSDAGAARRSWNPARITTTAAFLDRLEQLGLLAVAWLNPVPCLRWSGTSAAAIQQIVPMSEMNRQGLGQAVAVLRGRDHSSSSQPC